MNTQQVNHDEQFLRAALAGYEQRRREIDERIADIKAQLSFGGPAVHPFAPVKRNLSAAARRRISAAQRKRWAAHRAAKAKTAAKK